MEETISEERVKGSMTPGQCAKPASRMPPSQVDPLPTFQYPAYRADRSPSDPPDVPWTSHGPLSAVNKMSVLPRCRWLSDLPHERVDLRERVAKGSAARSVLVLAVAVPEGKGRRVEKVQIWAAVGEAAGRTASHADCPWSCARAKRGGRGRKAHPYVRR